MLAKSFNLLGVRGAAIRRVAKSRLMRLWVPTRIVVTIFVFIVGLRSATVAFAQVSQDYDIACRSWLTAAGGTISNGTHSLSGALGVPIAPPRDSELAPTYAVRSPSYGLRGGFLPGYPTSLDKPSVKLEPPAQSNFVQRLPIIYKVMFVVRFGC